jgi:hypothetical protein
MMGLLALRRTFFVPSCGGAGTAGGGTGFLEGEFFDVVFAS